MLRRFVPFLSERCKLPACSFEIISIDEISKFNKDNPSFSSYFRLAQSGFASFDTYVVGDYLITPCSDGAVLQVREPIWAWVHDKWRRIDIVLNPDKRFSPNLFALMMRAYQYTAIYSNALMMHSAAITFRGKGILFCGKPGAGKSTQARLWEQVYGAETINNDQPCIIYDENGSAFVSGSPWSGKEPCYKNIAVPISAVVFVEKSKVEQIEPLSHAEAYSLLYLNEYVYPVQTDTEEMYCNAIAKLVNSVPVYRQYCTATIHAPRTLYEYLAISQ